MSKKIEKQMDDFLNIKISFNDYCMREIGLGLDDNNYLIDDDVQSKLCLKGKNIKYNDEVLDPITKIDEMDLNLIENFRLMEIIFQVFITKYIAKHPLHVKGFLQRKANNSNKGVFAIQVINNGVIEFIESEPFYNDSVRIFNLICKLNGREHIYDFNKLDVIIDKETRKKWRNYVKAQ